MQLRIEYQETAQTAPVISVDGAWGAPGLNLSHWPGNLTPANLKARTSTEIALRFAALPASDRSALAVGCTAIANNHYDTDGVCALFAVRHPSAALERAQALTDAAVAGDFFQWPSDFGVALDATLTALVDPQRSPWKADYAGLDDLARYTRCTERLLDELPRMIDQELAQERELWAPVLERGQRDRQLLATCAQDELVHLDYIIWTTSPRATGAPPADPGRHALFGSTTADRVLVVEPGASGTTYRFIIGTQSWFDLPDSTHQPRPDLKALVQALNQAEGTSATDDACWRQLGRLGASPELWFGRKGLAKFGEHAAPFLSESSLAPERVKSLIVDALRAVFVFPDEDELL